MGAWSPSSRSKQVDSLECVVDDKKVDVVPMSVEEEAR